jgi:hypothetical protein
MEFIVLCLHDSHLEGTSMALNLREYYRKSDVVTKKKIPSCIFADKLVECLRATSFA